VAGQGRRDRKKGLRNFRSPSKEDNTGCTAASRLSRRSKGGSRLRRVTSRQLAKPANHAVLTARRWGRIRLTRQAAYRSESADGSGRGNPADHGNRADTDAGSRSGSRSPRGSSRSANSGSGRTAGTGSSSDSDSDGYGCRTRFPGNLGAAGRLAGFLL